MDVLILAGGFGTRLKGIWDHPKCLLPVGGEPLLAHLLRAVEPLRPTSPVALALGHKAEEVIAWVMEQSPPLEVSTVIEDNLLGTAGALRLAVFHTLLGLEAPLLVLNGDTLPLYDLVRLVTHHFESGAKPHKGATIAWCNCFAGAAVIGPETLTHIEHSTITSLDLFLLDAMRYPVPGFLDVGTPGGFQKAQELETSI